MATHDQSADVANRDFEQSLDSVLDLNLVRVEIDLERVLVLILAQPGPLFSEVERALDDLLGVHR